MFQKENDSKTFLITRLQDVDECLSLELAADSSCHHTYMPGYPALRKPVALGFSEALGQKLHRPDVCYKTCFLVEKVSNV